MGKKQDSKKPEADMSRREFLIKGSIFGALLAAGGFGSCGLSRLLQSNSLTDKIPDHDPFAVIEKYDTPGAKHLFVHVRQIHTLEECTDEEIDLVSKLHDEEIYPILKRLTKHLKLNELYGEGITVQGEKEFQEKIDKLAEDYRSDDYLPAGLRLSVTDKVRLRPTADSDFDEKCSELFDKFKAEGGTAKTLEKSEAWPVMTGGREDMVLSVLSKEDKPIYLVLYGGAHDFRDNIEKWNIEHPEHKFSLVVVSPKSYDKIKKGINELE